MARTVKGTLTIEGQEIQITNPDKPLWPEVGITKAIYLQKLAAISPYLLRYCRGRLLTTIRYPHGVDGESFYQKNAPLEVQRDVSPTDFHLLNIEQRLKERGDLLQALPPQPIGDIIRHLNAKGKPASKRKG
ncbi:MULTISPECIES: non-homologous end-joining DNA ligase LigD [Paenibacillus]|uniref:non-homologous end-joining DNA ligase LigD n=1 Tax=Paenibacillus TaxID=44249 RepID=UPI0011A36094|nr:hypothetical protein [Paenibacillus sp. IHBB 10380]